MSVSLKSVLISDPVDDTCGELFAKHGISVTKKYKLSKEELIKELQNHDGLIVRSETKVTAEVLNAAPNLRVVGRAGTGVDNIDLPTATRRGIVVLNTPGGNSISACELTCSLISALARNVVQAGQSLKEGRWDRKLYSGFELSGKTLAVLGFGRIGREVASRMQSYGVNIVAFDPMLKPESAVELNVTKLELEQIWPVADIITVHTPLIPQTKNLINATTLGKCKKGVYVVNVARGGIVDEEALLAAIKSGQCGGAALDVFLEEPPKNPITWELIKHPKVVGTPHLGASTAEAQSRVGVEIAEQILGLVGKIDYAVSGIVNAPVLAATMSPENGPWIELSRKLGQLGARFLSKSPSSSLESQVAWESNDKGFIHTAVLLGLLADQVKSNVNLVNAASLAKEAGVQVKETHVPANYHAVTVKVGQHSVTGTVRDNEQLLVSIDNVNFGQGVQLGDHVSLHRVKGQQDLANVVNACSTKGINISSLNINNNWLVLQTSDELSIQVPGVESF